MSWVGSDLGLGVSLRRFHKEPLASADARTSLSSRGAGSGCTSVHCRSRPSETCLCLSYRLGEPGQGAASPKCSPVRTQRTMAGRGQTMRPGSTPLWHGYALEPVRSSPLPPATLHSSRRGRGCQAQTLPGEATPHALPGNPARHLATLPARKFTLVSNQRLSLHTIYVSSFFLSSEEMRNSWHPLSNNYLLETRRRSSCSLAFSPSA